MHGCGGLGSVATGVLIGLACCYFMKNTDIGNPPQLEISMLFLFAYGSYAFAESLELSGIKVIVPGKWVGEVTGGTKAALDLAVAALRAAGATVEELPADDEAFAALDAAIEGAELCKFGLGPSTARRAPLRG